MDAERVRFRTDVEARLARHTARRAVVVGPALIGLFWLLRGGPGAAAAAIAVAAVVVNFLLAGTMLSLAARISLALYQATALFGFFLRLALLTLTMVVIVRAVDLDRLAFGITAVAAYLLLLFWEAAAVAKGAERELEWTA